MSTCNQRISTSKRKAHGQFAILGIINNCLQKNPPNNQRPLEERNCHVQMRTNFFG
jgi:hypothetical protein